MGLLVDGHWVDQWYDTESSQGRFIRSESQFRNWITADGTAGPSGHGGFKADGTAGPSGHGGFKAEPGRYHLYVSLACPWAHRTLIFRALKGLESMISVSVVNSYMGDHGWTFDTEPGAEGDQLYGLEYLYQLYQKTAADYSGRVTVPVLWDKQRQTIVNNESAEIIRMLNSAFDHLGAKAGDYYPPLLRSEIDTLNEEIYHRINNGVYKAGFATTQDAYEQAVFPLFEALDALEQRLSRQRYLLGNQITEADWRLFTTLIRFDAVYHGHFKCNLKRLIDYPSLWAYIRELYQWPGMSATVNMAHIKGHYYRSHHGINPTGIVPAGPTLDFNQPHQREHLGQ